MHDARRTASVEVSEALYLDLLPMVGEAAIVRMPDGTPVAPGNYTVTECERIEDPHGTRYRIGLLEAP